MSTTTRIPTARRRLSAAAAVVVVVAAGLAVHRFGAGVIGDIAGDALYAALVYLLLVLLLPRCSRRVVAALAIVFCIGVEMLQLTSIPHEITDRFPAAILVLGASFDRRDIIVYAFAVIAIMIVDAAISRMAAPRTASR